MLPACRARACASASPPRGMGATEGVGTAAEMVGHHGRPGAGANTNSGRPPAAPQPGASATVVPTTHVQAAPLMAAAVLANDENFGAGVHGSGMQTASLGRGWAKAVGAPPSPKEGALGLGVQAHGAIEWGDSMHAGSA